jgi:transposase
MLAEQYALLGAHARRLAAVLNPLLRSTPDVQRLVWVLGIGRIVASTIVLEIDGFSRFPSARDFVSSCRLVPGAGNSGGRMPHKRTKDGSRSLTLAFSHAAVRAIQYFPAVRAFSRATARRKRPALARALVAKELARIVDFMLKNEEPVDGTFNGKPLSRTKTPKWPRLVNPPVQLEPAPHGADISAACDWDTRRRAGD